MADAEIIKALECCSKPRNCGECPYLQECSNGKTSGLEADALDLINRQKAEIERLNKEGDRLSQIVLYHDGQIADAKAEGIFEGMQKAMDLIVDELKRNGG